MEKMVIRKIRLEDAGACSRIWAAITKSRGKVDFRKIIEVQTREDADVSFVAEIDGNVAGYMIGYIIYGGFGLEKSAWIASWFVVIE